MLKDEKPVGETGPGTADKPVTESVADLGKIENVEEFLAKDVEKVNEALAKEETESKGKKSEEKTLPADRLKPKKLTDIPRTPIDEVLRKKLNIPEKFKDWESYANWASEAEKAKSRAESERERILKERTDFNEKLASLQETVGKLDERLKQGVREGDISQEEREEIRDRFLADWNEDPLIAMEKLFTVFKGRIDKESEAKTKKEQESLTEKKLQEEGQKRQQTWNDEEEELMAVYEREGVSREDYLKSIAPAMVEMLKQKPNLFKLAQQGELSITEIHDLYLIQKEKEQQELEAEAETKRNEKKEAVVETGAGVRRPGEGDRLNKITGAKTIADLEAASEGL